MRQVEVRTVDQDLKGLFVQGDFTGLSFTKKDINLMLDELIATQTRTGAAPKRTRNELLTELVMRSIAATAPIRWTVARCNTLSSRRLLRLLQRLAGKAGSGSSGKPAACNSQRQDRLWYWLD